MKKLVSVLIMVCLMAVMLLGTTSVSFAEEKETYIWCAALSTLPLFVNNDYIGLDLAAEELDINIRKVGPQEMDIPALVAAMEQEIAKKPDGALVAGFDSAQGAAIDKMMEAGIPVVTCDADITSNRLCFVGTDWVAVGREQAKAVAPYIADKTGRAVGIGLAGGEHDVAALEEYAATLATLAPNVEVDMQIYNSETNATVVAETIGNLLASDDSIVAVAGFDATCGPGIAQAIKEAGKVGQVYGTCIDAELEHLQGVKDGALAAAVGQKRHFFTYYGMKMLYDVNHSKIDFTGHDKELGITNIPETISTGFIIATADNVDVLIEAAEAKAAK